jgi:hypothetical protein
MMVKYNRAAARTRDGGALETLRAAALVQACSRATVHSVTCIERVARLRQQLDLHRGLVLNLEGQVAATVSLNEAVNRSET